MATLYVNTDDQSGGEYASLALAEADLPTTLTEPYVIECGGATADTTATTIEGVTTDATNNLTIIGDSGGIWDSSKYRLSTTIGTNINAAVNYTHFKKLQLSLESSGSGYRAAINLGSSSSIDGVLVAIRTTAIHCRGFFLSSGAVVKNSIVYNDGVTQSGTAVRATNTAEIYNCGVYNNGYGIYLGWSPQTVKNCILVDNNINYYAPSGTAYLSNNITSDNTSLGTNSLINQVATDLFTDPANFDFTLKAGSNAIGAGVDLSADFTTDITGATRAVPWDIGAFMYAVAAGLQPPTNLRVVNISPTETRLEWDAP